MGSEKVWIEGTAWCNGETLKSSFHHTQTLTSHWWVVYGYQLIFVVARSFDGPIPHLSLLVLNLWCPFKKTKPIGIIYVIILCPHQSCLSMFWCFITTLNNVILGCKCELTLSMLKLLYFRANLSFSILRMRRSIKLRLIRERRNCRIGLPQGVLQIQSKMITWHRYSFCCCHIYFIEILILKWFLLWRMKKSKRKLKLFGTKTWFAGYKEGSCQEFSDRRRIRVSNSSV